MNRLQRNMSVMLLFSLFLFSCAAPQKTLYFSNNAHIDTTSVPLAISHITEGLIQPDDILSISITSISSITDKDPVGIFREGGTNFPVTAIAGGVNSSSGQNAGYLVDKMGYIDFPVLGKIQVGGKTIRECKEVIAEKLRTVVKEPVVEVRIINYTITVLGEVGRPGTLVAPNHKINIIEAIAAAGDIPITGKKENVMVIREVNGQRVAAKLNLNSREVFGSPFYYLKQNDIVYVEPSKVRRQENNTFTRVYLPTLASLLSVALAVYGIVQIINNK